MNRLREDVAENADTDCDDCEYSELEAALSEQPEATLDGQGEAVDWDEWMDRFAETCDRSADALGWIHLADGRVFGSRELFLAITSKIPPSQPEVQGVAVVQTVNPENPDLSTEIPLPDLLAEAERVAANLMKKGHYLAATLMRALANLAGSPLYTAAPKVAEGVEAVELTLCCGREECGGECGNEWRGTHWVRKADRG